jgi:hypothetical protein
LLVDIVWGSAWSVSRTMGNRWAAAEVSNTGVDGC